MRYMEFVLIPRSKVALMPRPFNVELENFQSRLQNRRIAEILNRIPRAWSCPDFTEAELNSRRLRVAEAVGFIMEDEKGGIMPPTFPELIEDRFTEKALVKRDSQVVSNMAELLKGGTRHAVLNDLLSLEAAPYEVQILIAASGETPVGDLLKTEKEAGGLTPGERKSILKKMLQKGFLKFADTEK
jgi:hypothetical protein